MLIKRIKKKSGGYRIVYIPNSERKRYLKDLSSKLLHLNLNGKWLYGKLEWEIFWRTRVCEFDPKQYSREWIENYVIHGFRKGFSPVTNAIAHFGYRYSLTFDIKDCFDSTTLQKTLISANYFSPKLYDFIREYSFAFFEDGAARQGLPSSPIIANIALAYLDSHLVLTLRDIWHKKLPSKTYFYNGRYKYFAMADFFNRKFSTRCKLNSHMDEIRRNSIGINVIDLNQFFVAYTRYADDITISTNRLDILYDFKNILKDTVAKYGYQINPSKTRLQKFTFGNRVITGVSVGEKGIKPTRKVLKKLRAARHQNNIASMNGLAEWCKLKLPNRGIGC